MGLLLRGIYICHATEAIPSPTVRLRTELGALSNLFAISAVHNITIHEFALHLAGQTGDNFALMSAHE